MASVKKRKLANGTYHYDVRYRTPDGTPRTETYRTRGTADQRARNVETDKDRGAWIDPKLGLTLFRDYADTWLKERTGLKPRSLEIYESTIRVHLKPAFGDTPVAKITPGAVRAWYAEKRAASPAAAGRAYQLLHTILNTAVTDEFITRNPCRVKGAQSVPRDERPVATVDVVWALATNAPPRYRTVILLGTYGSLRLGEIAGLRRRNVDIAGGYLDVVEQLQRLDSGELWVGPPKSAAGLRRVQLPSFLVEELDTHLTHFTSDDPDALVFTFDDGQPLTRQDWSRVWRPIAAKVPDLPAGFRFHDLRGTGATLASQGGASLREVMTRLGHSTMQTALGYQHSTDERQKHIARTLDHAAMNGDALDTGLDDD